MRMETCCFALRVTGFIPSNMWGRASVHASPNCLPYTHPHGRPACMHLHNNRRLRLNHSRSQFIAGSSPCGSSTAQAPFWADPVMTLLWPLDAAAAAWYTCRHVR